MSERDRFLLIWIGWPHLFLLVAGLFLLVGWPVAAEICCYLYMLFIIMAVAVLP